MGERTVACFSLSEPSQLESSLSTLRMKGGIALAPGSFGGSVAFIEFGDIAVEIIRTSPALLIKGSGPGRSGRMLMLEGAARAKWDGRPVNRYDIAALDPDTTLVASLHEQAAFAFVSAREAGGAGILGTRPEAAGNRQRPLSVRRSAASGHGRLAACIRDIEKTAQCAPGILQHEQARAALRASLVRALGDACEQPPPASAARTRVTRRHRVVRRVDEYLCANPVRPIYTDDLCRALGVSSSALHEAFQDVLEMSPHRYLKLRRMSLVRAALLSPAGPRHSVKAAALSFGFWHLGQFAQDYREIYGELPSATLARSGSGNG